MRALHEENHLIEHMGRPRAAVPGAFGIRAAGAGLWKPAIRVAFRGTVAMASTAMIGSLIGRAV